MTHRNRLALLLSAGFVSLGLALAPVAYAQDASKEDMSKEHKEHKAEKMEKSGKKTAKAKKKDEKGEGMSKDGD
jgi:pentapeptide MXKDX repeat protein